MKMFGIGILCSLSAWFTSKVVFAYTGFEYNVFSDPFHPGSLLLDMGVYILPCLVVAVLFRKSILGSLGSSGNRSSVREL